jgi:serine/threonine protein kinase
MQDPIDSRGLEPDETWHVGDLIEGRYEVVKTLIGGMGVVYICLDREDGLTYALKTLQKRFLRDQSAIDLFLDEMKTWISLGKHRNIVPAVWISSAGRYIVLEYVRPSRIHGNTLRSYMLTGKLSLSRILDFAIQICDGMIHATRVVPSLVHRDIKPENIMIDSDGVVKITDFGLAKVAGGGANENFLETAGDEIFGGGIAVSRSGAVMGTPPYMSPEQILGLRVDTRSDIYSFGAVLYEMLTARLLFQVSSVLEFLVHHVHAVPKSPKSIDPTMPGTIDSLVMKCLRKDPKQRFQNFNELRKELDDILIQLTGRRFQIADRERPLGPKDWEQVDLGASLIAIGKLDEAISTLKNALASGSLTPRFKAKAHNNLGCAYSARARAGKGRRDEAMSEFKEALKVDPNYAKAHYNLGLQYVDNEMFQEAISEFQKALQIIPTYEEARTELDTCLKESKARESR